MGLAVEVLDGEAFDFGTLKSHIDQRLDLARCERSAEQAVQNRLAIQSDPTSQRIRGVLVGEGAGHGWKLSEVLTVD